MEGLGVVGRAGAGNERHALIDRFGGDADHRLALGEGEGSRLASSASHRDAMRAAGYLPVDEFCKAVQIDFAIFEWGDNGDNRAAKHRYSVRMVGIKGGDHEVTMKIE